MKRSGGEASGSGQKIGQGGLKTKTHPAVQGVSAVGCHQTCIYIFKKGNRRLHESSFPRR